MINQNFYLLNHEQQEKAKYYNLTKIIIAGQEFLLLEQPISTIYKLFGLSKFFVRQLSQRFELYQTQTLNNTNIYFFYDQLCEFIPAPYSFRFIYALNVTCLEYENSYKTYRHLFNLPANGQRT